jgi:hypothetical protein
MHKYLAGTVRGTGGVPIEINGVEDHVHLLVKIKPVIAVSDFLREIKSSSSGWARKKTSGRFAWQSRYGAFTVSESQVNQVRLYIRNQEEHHRKYSFEDEFKALLRLHNVPFDERYLWT